MKSTSIYTAIIFSFLSIGLMGQNNSFEKDATSIDALMKASYEVVFGEKGAKRQWERDRYLHHPNAVYSFFDYKKGQQPP